MLKQMAKGISNKVLGFLNRSRPAQLPQVIDPTTVAILQPDNIWAFNPWKADVELLRAAADVLLAEKRKGKCPTGLFYYIYVWYPDLKERIPDHPLLAEGVMNV